MQQHQKSSKSENYNKDRKSENNRKAKNVNIFSFWIFWGKFISLISNFASRISYHVLLVVSLNKLILFFCINYSEDVWFCKLDKMA